LLLLLLLLLMMMMKKGEHSNIHEYWKVLLGCYAWVWKTFTDVSEESTSYSLGLIFETEEWGATFLPNVDKRLSDYMT
jgi:hypothetical protein